jgi:hypothetical protein
MNTNIQNSDPLTSKKRRAVQNWKVPVDIENDCQRIHFSIPNECDFAAECKEVIIGLGKSWPEGQF